nr:MAG TPA: hypothetical protein [Caudoviricetes sp.]
MSEKIGGLFLCPLLCAHACIYLLKILILWTKKYPMT